MAFPSVGSSISLNQVNTELGYSSTSTITMNNINFRKWARRPAGVVFSTKTPELGSGGASPWPPSGWATDVNWNSYGYGIGHYLPFYFQFLNYSGNNYIVYCNNGMISNTAYNLCNQTSYSTAYPAKYSIGANMMSCQRMAHKTGPNNSYYKIRFEGTYNNTSGTPGLPNVVVEVTFFNPNITGDNAVMEIVTGTFPGNTGLYVDDGGMDVVQWIKNAPLESNQSYVIYSNYYGTSPFLYSGSYFSSGSNPQISLNNARGKAVYTSYGSFIEYICSGSNNHDLWGRAHNGIGGTFVYGVEGNVCQCGGTGPSYGTPTGYTDCDGGLGNYRTERYDGNCGTYFDIDYNNCEHCANQGAHGIQGDVAYEQCSNGNKTTYRYYNNTDCSSYPAEVTYNTCDCPGGTDGHYQCDELASICFDVDEYTVYWCSCNSQPTVEALNSGRCGGYGLSASCPC